MAPPPPRRRRRAAAHGDREAEEAATRAAGTGGSSRDADALTFGYVRIDLGLGSASGATRTASRPVRRPVQRWSGWGAAEPTQTALAGRGPCYPTILAAAGHGILTMRRPLPRPQRGWIQPPPCRAVDPQSTRPGRPDWHMYSVGDERLLHSFRQLALADWRAASGKALGTNG